MYERYTKRARLTIYHARYEALRRGVREIEPADIVLGFIRDSQPHGQSFEIVHLNAESVRKCIDPEPVYGPPTNWAIPLSASSKKALAYAFLEAKRDRRYSIDGDHLLRGVLLSGDETATKDGDAGYNLSRLRAASKEAQRSTTDVGAPFWWPLKIYGRKVLLGLGLLFLLSVVLYVHFQNYPLHFSIP